MKPLTACIVLILIQALRPASAGSVRGDEDAVGEMWEVIGFSTADSTHDVNFTASSTDSGKIKMWGSRAVHMNITAFIRPLDRDYQFAVFVTSNDDGICSIQDPEIHLTSDCLTIVEDDGTEEDLHICEIEFGVYGEFLGRTSLNFAIGNVNHTEEYVTKSEGYHIAVVYPLSLLDYIFNIVLTIMVALNNMGFGCKFQFRIVKEVFRRPVAPFIGMFCQTLILPVLGFTLAVIFQLPAIHAFGLVVLASCPSGGQSNAWSMLLDGDVMLSLCMTFTSNLITMASLPAWMYTLGLYFYGGSLDIPFKDLLQTLSLFLAALFVGIAIRRWIPRVADLICKVHRVYSFIYIVFLLSYGIYVNQFAFWFLSDYRIALCSMLQPWLGTLIAGGFARLFRQDWIRIKTIAIETAIQSSSVALLMLSQCFDDPESNISSTIPILATTFCPIPFILALTWKGFKEKGRCLQEKAEDRGPEVDYDYDEMLDAKMKDHEKAAQLPEIQMVMSAIMDVPDDAIANEGYEISDEAETVDTSNVKVILVGNDNKKRASVV